MHGFYYLMKYKAYLESGEVKSQADLARRLCVSRARITQTMNLLKLAPEIQRFIVNLEGTDKRLQLPTERRLRPLVQIEKGAEQYNRFLQLIDDKTAATERIRSQ